jgi:hypothetical protein
MVEGLNQLLLEQISKANNFVGGKIFAAFPSVHSTCESRKVMTGAVA